jgi:Xaa-Pro aminopeptidase
MNRAERLGALRAELTRMGVQGFLIPRADEHLGEYVPRSAERLAWLTGFTGSAGLAIVLPQQAAVFSDGRYTLQIRTQIDLALWEPRHITEEPPAEWLAAHADGLVIGYDPWLHSEPALERLKRPGVTFRALQANPIDAIWADRPRAPEAPARAHLLSYAGKPSPEKRAEAAAELRAAGVDAVVLADAHSIAWLLNIRGGDLDHTPLALGFALLFADGAVSLFMEPAKLDHETRTALGNAVAIAPRDAMPAALRALKGKRIRIDPEATPSWFTAWLREAGAEIRAGEDPCRMPRACKNAVEQEGARAAHQRDAVAMARFLRWFAEEAPKGSLNEISAAARLLAFRRDVPLFQAESFPAISGAGENGEPSRHPPQ